MASLFTTQITRSARLSGSTTLPAAGVAEMRGAVACLDGGVAIAPGARGLLLPMRGTQVGMAQPARATLVRRRKRPRDVRACRVTPGPVNGPAPPGGRRAPPARPARGPSVSELPP